ncbi:host cell division inhibitor Icd-like protein [Orbus hercynius]|uniref:host cell division inhibitor Icd-like protein n=1 Tax=Orbus hercynius TaxID=593135 RepID=UPI000EAF6B45|nr:host cell division inhibitor Icd-like protein [Orbus hercynius]
MANRYDSAHLRARQSKLYKFYNSLTAQVVQTIATTERQARQNLGKQSLIFIARKPLTPTFEHSINWGGYHHA